MLIKEQLFICFSYIYYIYLNLSVTLPVPQHPMLLAAKPQIVTYVGMAVGLACLLVAMVLFCCVRNFGSNLNSIHMNTIFCLFVAVLVFVAGIHRTDPEVRLLSHSLIHNQRKLITSRSGAKKKTSLLVGLRKTLCTYLCLVFPVITLAVYCYYFIFGDFTQCFSFF